MRPCIAMPGIAGDLSVMSLADVLIWLANRAKTGLLVLEHDYVRKEITIESGGAVRASSNNPREYLGQFLLNFGLITDEQLQRAFEVQQETKVLLGRILVMIGIVGEDQVLRTLEFKVRETILDALRYTRGRFTFHEGGPSKDRPEIEVAVPLVEIHREGAQRAPLWEAYLSLFPKSSLALEVIEPRVPPLLDPQSLDARILNLARAGLTIEAIGNELRAMDFHLYSRLFELHRLGSVESYDPSARPLPSLAAPPPTRPPPRSPPPPPSSTDEPLDLDDVSTERPRDAPILLQEVVSGLDEELRFSSLPSPAAGKTEDAVPILMRPLEEILKKRSSARERYILTRIDGVRTIGAIMQVVPMRDQEALEIFRSLAGSGFIRY